MSKLFKVKKTRGRNLLLIILPLIVLLVVFGVLAFSSLKGLIGSATGGVVSSSSFSSSIESMDYHLRSNATDLQKQLFTELKEECEKDETIRDEEKIAVLVAKNFVADFYTWTNKTGTTDVGGLYYVYSPNRTAILLQSRRYLYQHLNDYINQYGSNNLLEVASFGDIEKVTSKQSTVNEKKYDVYIFSLTWNYVDKNGGFDTSSYATRSWFRVYKNDDGRFEIIEIGE